MTATWNIAIYLVQLFCNNSSTKARGSAIYIFDRLNCIELAQTELKCDECENVWVELKLNDNKELIVGSVYTVQTP